MPRPGRRILVVALLLAAVVAAAAALAVALPRMSALQMAGRVTDEAVVLDADARARLEALSDALERDTCHQMVFVTVASLRGESVETFTRSLANAWGVGRKGHDDGVVLLVAPTERTTRIELGRGTEKQLNSIEAKAIVDNDMLPRFKEGDYAAGLEAGGAAVAEALRAAARASPAAARAACPTASR
jgi:uncharacterized protein